MKKTLLLLSFLSFFSVLQAQPLLVFEQTTRNMGTILWEQPKTAVFKLTNKSSNPLRITNVRTDCGCTSVSFPKEEIEPGGTGEICVSYNAELLGHFSKSVAVYVEGVKEPVYLRIMGNVSQTMVENSDQFPFQIGDYYLNTDDIEFDDVNRGDRPVFALQVYNGSKMSYRPQLMHLPRYLSAVAEPEVIRPGSVGRLYVTLDSEKLQNMGLTQTSIYLSRFEGDRVNKENEINVSTTLLPDFTDLPPQTELAPSLAIDSTTIVLTASDKRRKASGQILLRNTGRSPLVVKALQVYNPGISVSLGKRTLKPGAVEKLKISVSEMSDKCKGRRRILLITNDPEHAKVVIDVIVKK